MEATLYHSDIMLRKAGADDAKRVYQLSSDPLVRANSFDSDAFPYEEHIRWFNKKISDQSFLLLLGFYKDAFVGQVKFSIEDDHTIIGISVTESFMGRGAAKILIENGIARFLKIFPEIKTIKAYIKKENIPSIKLFEKCAFQFSGIEKVKGEGVNIYIRNI